MTEYVLGFCFDTRLVMVLLIRKTRPEWVAGRLNGVGGKVRDGEAPVQAMGREFSEEACCGAKLDWVQFGTLRGSVDAVTSKPWLIYLFHSVNPASFFPVFEEPEGKTELHFVDNVVARGELLRPLPSLRYLLPMALNHLRGDEVSLLDVREVKSC